MDVYASSRRTIMSGEVVTFATGFREEDGVFGVSHDATGPFDVSASRDAVMVHRAECQTSEAVAALLVAIEAAERARRVLRESHGESQYAKAPTLV